MHGCIGLVRDSRQRQRHQQLQQLEQYQQLQQYRLQQQQQEKMQGISVGREHAVDKATNVPQPMDCSSSSFSSSSSSSSSSCTTPYSFKATTSVILTPVLKTDDLPHFVSWNCATTSPLGMLHLHSWSTSSLRKH